MKKFLLAAIIFFANHIIAQTKITGHIKDNKGKPIAGVSITLKDTYDGAVSDSLGSYSFSTTEKGSHAILMTNINYDDYEVPVTLDNTPLTINATLKEKFNELKAVTVTAGAFEAGDNKRAATVL